MSREFTDAEIKAKFFKFVAKVTEEVASSGLSKEDACKELSVRILEGIAGQTNDLPQMILAPLPHKDDKAFFIGQHAAVYWPENHVLAPKIKGAISGSLGTEFKASLN